MRIHHSICIAVRGSDDTPNTTVAKDIFEWCKTNYLEEDGMFEENFYLDENNAFIATKNLEISADDFTQGFVSERVMTFCYDSGLLYDSDRPEEQFEEIVQNFSNPDEDDPVYVYMTISRYSDNSGSWTYHRMADSEYYLDASFDPVTGEEDYYVESTWYSCEDYPLLEYTLHGSAYLLHEVTLSEFPWNTPDGDTYKVIGNLVDDYLMDESEEKFAVVLPGDKCQFEGVSNESNKPMKIIKAYPFNECPEDCVELYNFTGSDLSSADSFVFMTDEEIENY